MSVMERRIQVLLDEERYQRAVAVARDRGMSLGALIREALDRNLDGGQRRRAAAADRVLSAPRMSVPAPDDLRRELDAVRARE